MLKAKNKVSTRYKGPDMCSILAYNKNKIKIQFNDKIPGSNWSKTTNYFILCPVATLSLRQMRAFLSEEKI